MNAITGFLRKVAARQDLALILLLILIVFMIILPLPTWLLDMMIGTNMALSLLILIVSIYLVRPSSFTTLPAILLFATLFRLAISIAITRSILLNAEGGHIVETFGNLVAGGNLVVGFVVFLIITVVQFIVIAKGAERVAEVAARFTLDAMPGKQLSIDSDLRSGLIDKDEAKRKRRLLEVESQLHGALDGAMKFVKGDAIAGIVIILINLLGGLAVGILQKGMEIGKAVQTYSILTIGDGLVAQLPAILTTICAGLIVTRTASEEDDRHLGDSIGRQISGQPRVVLITGIVCLLLMFVPGMPWPVFGVFAIGLLSLSAWNYRHQNKWLRRAFRVPEGETAPTKAKTEVKDELTPPPPLHLDISSDLAERMGGAAADALRPLRPPRPGGGDGGAPRSRRRRSGLGADRPHLARRPARSSPAGGNPAHAGGPP